jgi:hypothetical protein
VYQNGAQYVLSSGGYLGLVAHGCCPGSVVARKVMIDTIVVDGRNYRAYVVDARADRRSFCGEYPSGAGDVADAGKDRTASDWPELWRRLDGGIR